MSKIDWHAGFVPAMKLEFMENENDLIFEEEHPVDKRGNWIDLLIIKNTENAPLKSNLGAIFNRFNVVEYKSPDDTVTLGTFYKTLAYTGLYLKELHEYSKYGRQAFTMTIISSRMPYRLISQLNRDGITTKNTDVNGIISIEGSVPFRAQLIVTRLLSKDHLWLPLLTKNATKENLQELAYNTSILSSPKYREYADKVANTFLSANKDYIIKEMKEDALMCKAAEEIFKEVYKEEIAEKNAKLSEKDAELSKKEAQIQKLKEQIAKLQAQGAVL